MCDEKTHVHALTKRRMESKQPPTCNRLAAVYLLSVREAFCAMKHKILLMRFAIFLIHCQDQVVDFVAFDRVVAADVGSAFDA